MGLENSVDHCLLGNLIGAGLDHDHLFSGRCYGQSQVGYALLVSGWVDDKFAVDQAYLSGCAGAVKGNIGNAGCNGRTQHGSQLRAALRIYGHNYVVQSYVIAVVLGKQRTHGAVDHTGGQNGIFRSLSLSLIETAGDFAYCVKLLLIFYA